MQTGDSYPETRPSTEGQLCEPVGRLTQTVTSLISRPNKVPQAWRQLFPLEWECPIRNLSTMLKRQGRTSDQQR